MKAANETALYRNGNDLITETHATLGGQSFTIADIDTVSLVAPVLRREYGYGLIGLGVVIALVGYLVWGVFLTPMLVGVVLVVVGVAVATIVKFSYNVNLNRKSGQTSTLQFPDRAQAERIVAALSGALSRRR